VFDGSKNAVTIFKDGQKIAYILLSSAYSLPTTANCYLLVPDTTNVLEAELTELRFWNRPVEPGEVEANRLKRIDSNTSSLVMYFPFNGQGSGTNPGGIGNLNSSGQQLDYIVPNEGPFSFEPFQGCCSLNSNYLTTSSNSNSIYNDLTIGFWLKRASFNTLQTVFWFYYIYINFEADNTVVFGAGTALKSPVLNQNQGWQYWAFTVNTSQNKAIIYLNGEVLVQGALGTYYSPNYFQLNIGKGQTYGNYCTGSITEVSLWNRTLSKGEINKFKNKRIIKILNIKNINNKMVC
jgi:hypothetical protein